MSWSPSSPCGVILYPALNRMPFNWSSEAAWAGNNWLAETGSPARNSEHAFFGDWSIKFDTSDPIWTALARFNYDPLIWGTMNAGPFCQYAFIYPTAIVGAPVLRLLAELETGGNAYTTFFTDYDLSTFPLNQWSVIRNVAPLLTSAQQANFASVDLRVQVLCSVVTDGLDGGAAGSTYILDGVSGGDAFDIFLNGIDGGDADSDYSPESATLWVDGCQFGYALDLQDLLGSLPVLFDSPMDDVLGQDRVINVAEDGTPEVVRFAQADAAAGMRTGNFKAAYFDGAGVDAADVAWQFLSGSTGGRPRAFTLIGNISDLDRNVVVGARLTGRTRGIEQLEETEMSSWTQSWEEDR